MTVKQCAFYKKNWADFERSYVVVTASQGVNPSAIIDRSNRTAWATDGSVDADNTTIVVDTADVGTIDSIFLLKHNFKSYKVEYWDDIALTYNAFSPAIDETTYAADDSYYEVGSVQTSKVKITIRGTQTPDSDKFLFQFIMTQMIGRLEGWPIIKKPTLSRNLKEKKMASGKSHILANVGGYSAVLAYESSPIAGDNDIVEALHDSSEGFLFWPCGGSEDQFSRVTKGYRMEDIYLVRCKNEYQPEFAKGFYQNGIKQEIDLVEVIT